MTDDRSQQKDQGLSNLSVDPDLLARELAAEDDMDPLDAIQLDDAEQDSSLEIARACDQGLIWLRGNHGERLQGLQVFCFFLKVAKAGEKVENVIKSSFPEGFPHVMGKKVEALVLKLTGELNDLSREVKTCYIVPLAGQVAGVAAFAAGQVEHTAACRRIEGVQKVIDEAFCFRFIPVFV